MLFGLSLLLLPAGQVQAASPVGGVAVAKAQRNAAPRRGGFIRHAWHTTKGAIFSGAVGAGIGYLLSGPAGAINIGVRSAGGGAAFSSMTGGGRTGVFKRSARCFAKADLAEAKGQVLRKHFNKIKGVAWCGVESAAVNAVTMGGLGCVISGPAGVVPAATTGAVIGGCFGVVTGAAQAYVVPFFKRRSLGWSMHKAGRALKHLAQEPDNPAWQAEAMTQLRKVQTKKDRIPRLGNGQAQRYQQLAAQAQQLSQQVPRLAGIASGL